MTTTTERRTPEHPRWQPWWIRYAEWEGRRVRLIDAAVQRRAKPLSPHPWFGRYSVQVGPGYCARPMECPEWDLPHWHAIGWYDDLREAEAAFERAARQLIGEDA